MHSAFYQRQSGRGSSITPLTRARGRDARRGRNTSRGRGYTHRGRGYVNRLQRNSPASSSSRSLYSPKYKKNAHSNQNQRNPKSSYTSYTSSIISTKSKYYKSRTIREVIAINEIRINDSGSVEEYVDYALNLLNYKNKPLIYITATSRSICKAINCVEIIKRKQNGVFQETLIEYKTIREIYKPLEYRLTNVIIDNEQIFIKIFLTFNSNLLNKNGIGYQEPIRWIDLSDAKQLYNKMQNSIQKLESYLADQRDEINELTDKYDSKCNDLNQMRRKRNECYADLEHKYDTQCGIILEKDAIIGQQNKDYNSAVANMNVLKTKYDLLFETENNNQKINDDNNNNNHKISKYNDLNCKQLVDLIIGIDIDRYEIYREGLLLGFIEEGVDGCCLYELTKEDLYRFGVTKFKDKFALYNAIHNLE